MDHGKDTTCVDTDEQGYTYDDLKWGGCLQRLELPGPAYCCSVVKVKKEDQEKRYQKTSN